eukprot:1816291-Rhodomonas_salina.3
MRRVHVVSVHGLEGPEFTRRGFAWLNGSELLRCTLAHCDLKVCDPQRFQPGLSSVSYTHLTLPTICSV